MPTPSDPNTPSELMRAAGHRLKRVRLAAGYGKQKELTDALGVAAGTYSKWELGDRRPPNHILARIKGLTGATADYLFLGDLPACPSTSTRR